MQTEKIIANFQKESLKKAKAYLKKSLNKNIDIEISPCCDFVTWVNCLGCQKIKLLKNNAILSFGFLKALLIEIFSIGKNYDFLQFKSLIKNKKKINVIYSYCSKENFSNKGIFYDYYFNCGSSLPNTYWFLISTDNYIPKKCKNISIVYRGKKNYNIVYLLRYLFKNFLNGNILHNINNTSNVSKIWSKMFFDTFKDCKFNLFLPFENRPHQNAVIRETKNISKNNQIYCYYHRMPEPLQSEMFYKNEFIKKLFVCSNIQKKVFQKYFMWPSKKIKVIPSLRYKKLKIRKNIIFLPYEIKKESFYIEKLKFLIKKNNIKSTGFKISIHPLKKNSQKHNNLKNKIYLLLKTLKNKNKKNCSIILGEPGGVAAECLQTNGKVYHITDSFFDVFSKSMWKYIETSTICDSIYLYKMNKKQTLLNTNNKTNNFKYLNLV